MFYVGSTLDLISRLRGSISVGAHIDPRDPSTFSEGDWRHSHVVLEGPSNYLLRRYLDPREMKSHSPGLSDVGPVGRDPCT